MWIYEDPTLYKVYLLYILYFLHICVEIYLTYCRRTYGYAGLLHRAVLVLVLVLALVLALDLRGSY